MVGNANEKYNQLELGGRVCMGMVHYIHNIVKKKRLSGPFPPPPIWTSPDFIRPILYICVLGPILTCETIFCIYIISGIQIWYQFVQQNAAIRTRTHYKTQSVQSWVHSSSLSPKIPHHPMSPLSPNPSIPPSPKPKSLNPPTPQSINPSLLSSILSNFVDLVTIVSSTSLYSNQCQHTAQPPLRSLS